MQENADGFVELGKGIKISPPEEMEAVESRAALVVRPDTSTPKDDKLGSFPLVDAYVLS